MTSVLLCLAVFFRASWPTDRNSSKRINQALTRSAFVVAQPSDYLQTGDLPLGEREDVAELDGAAWEVAGNQACDSCVCGSPGDVGDGDGGAVLRGRLLHPCANGRKAAPLLAFILDDGTLGERADHGVNIVIVVSGEIRG